METSSTSPSLLDRKSGQSSTLQSRDKLVEAIVNKLVAPRDQQLGGQTNRIPTTHELSPIIRDTVRSIDDADNVLRVLPDLNLASEIQIASILSSKDLITTALIYNTTADEMDLDLRTEMLNIIKDYFNDDYKLNEYLYDIVYDVLYRTGSYAVSIIPESAVDSIINGVSGTKVSLESITEAVGKHLQHKGILGPLNDDDESRHTKFGFEALTHSVTRPTNNENMTITFAEGSNLAPILITDNPDVTKMTNAQAAIASAMVDSAYTVATEDFQNGELRGADKRYYKNPLYSAAAISEVQTAELAGRPSIGRPLVQHYPSESVIPIHTPGDSKLQVGYLVVLDNLGNPVSRDDLINSNLAWSWMTGTADEKVKQNAAQGLGVSRDINSPVNMTVSQLTNSFADIVEGKVINAIKNGVYGDSVTMSRPQDVYRIMMARSLAKKATQLLYVPVEQMTYFALDYNKYGVGESLLDKNRMLSTVRTALQFATLNGSILNSTRNLEYTIQLDPGDREAEKTIEDIRYRVMQSYNSEVPLTGTPDDMWAYMTNAGLSFNVEGNEFYPTTKTTVQDNSPDYKIPDQTTEEEFAKRHYRGLGLDPELIISPDQIEFASQVTSKNLLSARRICKIQERLNPFLTQFVKTYIISDGILLKELSLAIRTYYPEESKQPGVIGKYINKVLRTFTVTLPSPDTSMLGSQMEQFDARSDALDKILETFITDETLQDTELNIDTARARAIYKAYLMRQWLRDNDVEPDLIDMFDDIDRRAEIVQTIANDSVDSSTLTGMLFNRIEKRLATVSKKFDLNEPPMDTSTSDGEDGGFGGEDDSMGGDDMFGGEDDFDDGDAGDGADVDGTTDDGSADSDDTVDADTDNNSDGADTSESDEEATTEDASESDEEVIGTEPELKF